MMQKLRWADIVHVLGSVASITGISLLWLKPQLNTYILVVDIPIIVLLVLFSLGIVSIGIIAIRFGWTQCFETKDPVGRLAYFSLAISILGAIIFSGLGISWYLVLKEVSFMKG